MDVPRTTATTRAPVGRAGYPSVPDSTTGPASAALAICKMRPDGSQRAHPGLPVPVCRQPPVASTPPRLHNSYEGTRGLLDLPSELLDDIVNRLLSDNDMESLCDVVRLAATCTQLRETWRPESLDE